MRRRYVTRAVRPRAYEYEDAPLLPNLTVYEQDDGPIDTGLVDHHGHTIMAVLDRESIGFVELREAE